MGLKPSLIYDIILIIRNMARVLIIHLPPKKKEEKSKKREKTLV